MNFVFGDLLPGQEFVTRWLRGREGRMMDDDYLVEIRRFTKFKGIVSAILQSVRSHEWCARNGVDIVPEIEEITPMELFFLGIRAEGRAGCRTYEEHEAGEVRKLVGDRIPVSDGEGFVYIFPRDLYEKILVFESIPD